jgi:outer membrane protein OmpA-like peptidoglycan-associated protein
VHIRLVLLGSVCAVALAGAASAEPMRHGWYVGLEGAWVHVNDASLPGAQFEFENRWGALGTLGHGFDGNWRLEVELGYRNNDLGQVNNLNVNDGDLTNWSMMANVVFDVPIAERWLVDLGAGAGVDKIRFDREIPGVTDADAVLAVQGLAGLTYRLGQHWDLALTYRYLWTDDPDLFVIGQTMEVTKHTVALGFRYGYDEPPPPPPPPAAEPPPPPPPPAPKQFIIFFGFNKCNITAEADAVLSEAAAAAKSSGSASVRIVGHTDSSGSASYNQKLSECRADAAKANLVGKGVAEGSISTSGKGESELMVQTGDGVKEPQNRRATVDLN